MKTIRHLLPPDISAKKLIAELGSTLLFDEDGAVVWFEVTRGGITIWRGAPDPDHKEQQRKTMRAFKRDIGKFERAAKLWRQGKGPDPLMQAFGIITKGIRLDDLK